MARLAAAKYTEIQPCPQCRTSVERKDLSNLCVRCTICKADQKKTYQFCWQCLKEWKGPAPRSDRCDNDGCMNRDLQLLQTCRTVSLPAVQGVTNCPSVRACPTCGMKVEHSQEFCKNIKCPRCHKEFCFVCLKLRVNVQRLVHHTVSVLVVWLPDRLLSRCGRENEETNVCYSKPCHTHR